MAPKVAEQQFEPTDDEFGYPTAPCPQGTYPDYDMDTLEAAPGDQHIAQQVDKSPTLFDIPKDGEFDASPQQSNLEAFPVPVQPPPTLESQPLYHFLEHTPLPAQNRFTPNLPSPSPAVPGEEFTVRADAPPQGLGLIAPPGQPTFLRNGKPISMPQSPPTVRPSRPRVSSRSKPTTRAPSTRAFSGNKAPRYNPYALHPASHSSRVPGMAAGVSSIVGDQQRPPTLMRNSPLRIVKSQRVTKRTPRFDQQTFTTPEATPQSSRSIPWVPSTPLGLNPNEPRAMQPSTPGRPPRTDDFHGPYLRTGSGQDRLQEALETITQIEGSCRKVRALLGIVPYSPNI
ncbi:MAG: hypothetical protein M1821_000217 [Bathelium mastoideum]|nr:MAG: hypothetical protein M1821_000217 [Bathelium mastoideum]